MAIEVVERQSSTEARAADTEAQKLVTVIISQGGRTFFLTLPQADLKFLETEEGKKAFAEFSRENGFDPSAYSIFDAPQAANKNDGGVEFLANAVLDKATAAVVEAKVLALHTIIEAGGQLTATHLEALVTTVDQMTQVQRARLSESVVNFVETARDTVKNMAGKSSDIASNLLNGAQDSLKGSLSAAAGSISGKAVDEFLKFTGLESKTAPRDNNQDTTFMVPTHTELQMMAYLASQRQN